MAVSTASPADSAAPVTASTTPTTAPATASFSRFVSRTVGQTAGFSTRSGQGFSRVLSRLISGLLVSSALVPMTIAVRGTAPAFSRRACAPSPKTRRQTHRHDVYGSRGCACRRSRHARRRPRFVLLLPTLSFSVDICSASHVAAYRMRTEIRTMPQIPARPTIGHAFWL